MKTILVLICCEKVDVAIASEYGALLVRLHCVQKGEHETERVFTKSDRRVGQRVVRGDLGFCC